MSDGLDIPAEVLGAAVVAQAINQGGGKGGEHAGGHSTACANCGAAKCS